MQKKPTLTLRQRVRVCLITKGMTQEELARMLGMDNSKLSRILRGFRKPTEGEAEKLAAFTGIPAREFSEVA